MKSGVVAIANVDFINDSIYKIYEHILCECIVFLRTAVGGFMKSTYVNMLSILGAILVISMVSIYGNPLYLVNDDVALAMFGGGFGSAASPEPHLVFSHVGYGLLLNLFAQIVGPYSHGWATLGLLGFCLALTINVAMTRLPAVPGAAMVLICLGSIYANALLQPHFTITSATLFGTSLLGFLHPEGRQPSTLVWRVAAGLLLVLSSLIWPEAFLMGVVVMAPLLIYLLWRGEGYRRVSAELLIAVIVIAIVGRAADQFAYAWSPQWNKVVEYNHLRGQFNDFGRVPWIEGAPEYKKVGWSANDYAMFMNWYSFGDVFRLENISYLVERLATPVVRYNPGAIWDWFSLPLRAPSSCSP